MIPGMWIVKCVDYAPGVCDSAPYGIGPGETICGVHARARKLLAEESVLSGETSEASAQDAPSSTEQPVSSQKPPPPP